MADEQKTEATQTEKTEQGKSDAQKTQESKTEQSTTQTTEKMVSEKQFKELQGGFTRASQENAELKKQMADIQERLKTAATTLSPTEKKELEDDEDSLIEKTKAEIKWCEENNVSSASQRLILKQTMNARQERIERQQSQKNMDSFTKFMEDHEAELKDEQCPYSMKELVGIQTDKMKAGESISLETARDIWIAKNQGKYSEAIAKMKEKANGARSVDGKETSPDGKGGKSVAKERWEAQFKK